MTQTEKMTALKAMVESGDTDEVLSYYLDFAGKKILARAYPFGTSETEVPVKYETVQVEIAAYMLNKRGAEGQISHSENGISRTFETGDIPASLMKLIIPECGVV